MYSTGLWESPSINTSFVHARNRCARQPLGIESNSIAKCYTFTNIGFDFILTHWAGFTFSFPIFYVMVWVLSYI